MASYKFLLTYSVKAHQSTVSCQNLADKVRKRIERLDVEGWTKLENVETVFSGDISLTSGLISEKIREATKQVKQVFLDQLKNENAYSDVDIYAVLMVNGLGESIEFSV